MTVTEELDVVPALPAKTISKSLSAGNPEPSNVSVGIDKLQSSRQRKVLDTVDKLRTCGLGSEISLPQLVVCGDQSAGKSSVLEALTEITFPRADELCTRFATEIVLRRAASEAIAIKIIPDTLRSSDEQHAIKAFNECITDFNSLTAQLSSLIEKAKIAMGIGSQVDGNGTRTFARDVLSIEIAGPGRPQLTVVDLPGMIQNENANGDKALVDELTKKYISQSRTICLAVITATNDADNQRILSLVKEADPNGDRSMGIITKPDMLPAGSGSEKAFIALASNANKKYFFKRGWHVLKNRSFDESNVTFTQRNEIEADFFRRSSFKALPQTSVGSNALRNRLSAILFEHVKSELPDMRSEVDKMIRDSEQKLKSLGNDRTTATQCRDYLIEVSAFMQEVGKNALHGNYEGEYFESTDVVGFDADSTWAVRRLRALLQQSNEGFAQKMRLKGHKFHIGQRPDDNECSTRGFVKDAELETLNKTSMQPISVSYNVALTWVRQVIARSRGRELQGNYNPLVIGELYRVQSCHWGAIAEKHIDHIASICSNFVYDALRHHSAEDVRDNVWTQHLEEKLRSRKDTALTLLQSFLRSFQDYPINHNHYYTETVQKIRQKRNSDHLQRAAENAIVHHKVLDKAANAYVKVERIDAEKFSQDFAQSTELDMLRFSCEEALDCMRAIYKVKQKVFIDVVITLVVEEHIVRGLQDILSPKVVSRMSDSDVRNLATEPDSVRNERSFCEDQLSRLREGNQLLRSVIGISD